MSEDFFRVRDQNFKKVETVMGYDHNWGELNLEPILVMLGDPTID